MLLQRAQRVEPEGRAVEMAGRVVVVELHDVQLLGQLSVVHAVEGHGVRAHGHMDVAMENLRLPMDEFHVGILLERLPLGHKMRVVPRVPGRGHVGEIVVPLAEQVQVPRVVQRVDGPELRPQMLAELRLTVGAEAAAVPGVDLVVDLPAENGGIVGEFLGHFFDDAQAVFVVMGVVGAAVPPPAVGRDAAVPVLHHHVGIQTAEPARRRGRGRAHHHADVQRAGAVDDLVKEGKVELAGLWLHAMPGEFADAHHVDADFLHARKIALHFLLGPVLGVVGHAQIGRLGQLVHASSPFVVRVMPS